MRALTLFARAVLVTGLLPFTLLGPTLGAIAMLVVGTGLGNAIGGLIELMLGLPSGGLFSIAGAIFGFVLSANLFHAARRHHHFDR